MAKRPVIPRVPMPEQDPQVRARNFEEVPYGYTPEMAQQEAQRCLQCKKAACRKGCPVEVYIPDFIADVQYLYTRSQVGSVSASADRNLRVLPALCACVLTVLQTGGIVVSDQLGRG